MNWVLSPFPPVCEEFKAQRGYTVCPNTTANVESESKPRSDARAQRPFGYSHTFLT